MPIYIRNPNADGDIDEWCIVEVQGDLEVRGEREMAGQFIGDLLYNKYGQPILIIGHHILHGRMQKIDKPLLVIEKSDLRKQQREGDDENDTMLDVSQVSHLDSTIASSNRTVLDSTVAVEHKTIPQTEYLVRAVVKHKVLFKARPKPIIANVAKSV
ncbi:chromosome transmission fidelity protein 8 homolog [Toxorhynchites rutilus septentrionalis]|uniref:chromosome transmission fidelity protein 8 homolog n=1 Tax=Toxorhynchites rutilus septentrionalis TaxID=329112 RepID=UPI0024794CCC|nr:chromosome transmission fidelity protein 8 homolog [Toxorhynchites rutilus septentrionalis]